MHLCVLGVSIFPLSTFFLLDFGMVPTEWEGPGGSMS